VQDSITYLKLAFPRKLNQTVVDASKMDVASRMARRPGITVSGDSKSPLGKCRIRKGHLYKERSNESSRIRRGQGSKHPLYKIRMSCI
jgi:hypothetical protein